MVELVDPNFRPLFALVGSFCYNLGFCLVPVFAFVIRDYVLLLTLYAASSAVGLANFWCACAGVSTRGLTQACQFH